MIYEYNQAEGRCDIKEYQGSTSRAEKDWATPRRRMLVHAVISIAFVCLMRIDEVLNLRFEDLKVIADNNISITLETRKTHQYGGK
jgi:integrase